jgi:hypothetical protein
LPTTTKVSAFVIPSLCESPVSVAADSANAVGAGVDAGTVVVVVGATVVVGGAVVAGAVVGGTVVAGAVVGGIVVLTDCDGVVATGVVGVGPAPNGATVEPGATGGTYPQPDNAIVREILIVEMTFAPLFTRS